MAADKAGNDIKNVGIPVTGFLAFAPEDATIPTPEQGKALDLALDPAFKKVGLITEDGGFEWSEEADGDALAFWQDGYTIPSGLAEVTLTFTAAEHSPITRKLRTGKDADEHGYLTVDGGGVPTKYTWITEEVFKNGHIRRRVARGRVKAAKLQQSERGSVQGIEFEIEIARDAAFGGNHYGEWVIDPAAVTPGP